MSKSKNVSIFISLLLRHKPEEVGLNMDKHGWVNVNDLIRGINNTGKYHIDMNELEEIVATDNKGRYVFNENKTKIKACQGHSIPWIEVELAYGEPPEFLYHGTTTKALSQIEHSGVLSKMKRHAVQLQSTMTKSWQSAERWGLTPVIVEINAKKMFEDGYKFGRSENDVWCVDEVPTKYFTRRIYTKE